MKKIFEEFKEEFEYCSAVQKIAIIGEIMLLVGMCIFCFGIFSLDLPLLVRFVIFLMAEGGVLALGCGLIDSMIM